jgi:hypothetical protein
MDTDELSTEAYEGILIEAEKFNHDLTLRFGLISYSCKNEKEYLFKSKILIERIKESDKSYLSHIFFGSPPDKIKLRMVLEKILTNISQVEKIPEEKRHYEF